MSKSKNKRMAKYSAKMAEVSDRLSLKNKDGTHRKSALDLQKHILAANSPKYECAVKDKGTLRPYYVETKPIYGKVFIKKDKHGKDVVGSKLLCYVTAPVLDKHGNRIERPIPCFRDGTPRF